MAKKVVLFKDRLLGKKARIVLEKPYTLSSPDTTQVIDGESVSSFGECTYFRTGTVLIFDLSYWEMSDSEILQFLNEDVQVTFDIPGKKVHSIHSIGTFIASVHSISNLRYHAKLSHPNWRGYDE